jgi:hypothetical protein
MSTTAVTPQRVAEAFCKGMDQIDEIRAAANAQIEAVQAIQENRYNWLRENGFPIEFLIRIYIHDRDRKTLLNYEIKKIIDPFQAERESCMSSILQAHKRSKSHKTTDGIVFKDLKESVTVEDWDALLDYVRKNDKWNLLEKGVSKTLVLDEMGELEEDKETGDKHRPNGEAIPPGVKYNAFRTVKVRKS